MQHIVDNRLLQLAKIERHLTLNLYTLRHLGQDLCIQVQSEVDPCFASCEAYCTENAAFIEVIPSI